MDRGAWWATVHGAAKSWTQLSNFTSTFWPSRTCDPMHFTWLKFYLALGTLIQERLDK